LANFDDIRSTGKVTKKVVTMGKEGLASGTVIENVLYLQTTKGFSPIETGLAFLPMTAAIMITATSVNIRFLAKVGPRPLLILGMSLGAIAMLWLSQITVDSSYATHILPALIVMGIGMGNIFAPAFASATFGVDPHDSGVASAMVNTMQQVGGSIGTALLSSIFASAVTSYATSHARGPELATDAAMHGYTVAFWVAAGVFAFGAVVVGTLMRSIKVEAPAPGEAAAEPVAVH